MALSITLASLGSRVTRIASTAGSGIRRFAVSATTRPASTGGSPLVDFYDGLNRFGNSLMVNTLNEFKNIATFSWSNLWSQCVRGFLFIYNFNWNATDAELDAKIRQAEITLAATRGRLAGQSVGFAVCGVIPTATIAVFNEPLALHILLELGEEAAQEIASSAATLIRLQAEQLLRTGFINLFKNYRNVLRPAALGVAQLLVAAGRLSQESVDKANKKRNEPWSFASALDETVDEIKDPLEKAYAEEFYEEFADSCIEAGYIVAGGADSFFAQQAIAARASEGEDHTIIISPSRGSSSPTL